jgi:hypothetical protein
MQALRQRNTVWLVPSPARLAAGRSGGRDQRTQTGGEDT